MKKHLNSFHFILDTVGAKHDINAYLVLLRRDGNLTQVGVASEPLEVDVTNLIFGRRSFSGSLIGGLKETQEMLDFCGQHNITSDIELIPIQQVNEAYDRLVKGDVKAGDVIYISGAAGAVGNMAGQLAKLRGCRVIGSAGSEEKVKHLLDKCRFDAAFNYKTGPVLEQLNNAAPDGIDVYFDNVGGESLEAALSGLRAHGRIIACGGISGYNDEMPKPGPANLFNMTTVSPRRALE